MIPLPAPQHTHAGLGLRVALHARYAEEGRHIFEMLVEKHDGFRIAAIFRFISGILFQLGEFRLGLCFRGRALKDGPDFVEEAAQERHLWLQAEDFAQRLLLFDAQIFIGGEEDVTLLPQLSGPAEQFLRVPGSCRRFPTFFEIAPMTAECAPDFAPAILQDMKVIVLNMGLRINCADRLDLSLAMIDVEGRKL